MIVEADRLKKFVEIVGIGSLGNFEAGTEAGNLTSSVISASRAALVSVELSVGLDKDEEINIFANSDVFLKYLSIFDTKAILSIETNDDVVAMTDENATLFLFMPQISSSIASKNTGSLKSDLTFDSKVTFPAKDFIRIYKAMEKLEEDIIKFVAKDDKFEVLAGDKIVLKTDAEVDGNFTRLFRKAVLDDTLKHARGLISLEVNSQQQEYPVQFSYDIDDTFKVAGYMMPWIEEVDEDGGEE